MTGLTSHLNARDALRLAIGCGLLAMLGANLPGHLSYDSVAQLHEGHFHVRETWGPVLYARLLGFFDGFIPGAALYVVASALLFYASLASLPDLRERTSWLAVAVGLLVVLSPQVLIYQAIVWKDVMFANAAVAGFVCLAHAATRGPDLRRRWLLLGAALLLFAVASQVRQNGIAAAAFAALALGWIAGAGRWRRGLAWAAGGLAAVVVTAQILTSLAALPAPAGGSPAPKSGMSLLQQYDLVGAAALDPSYRLDIMAAARPAAAAVVRERARLVYSGQRRDFIPRDPAIMAALRSMSHPVVQAQWRDLILRRPDLYLRVRSEDFRWVFATPQIERCVPVHLGVDAPAGKLADLKLQPRFSQADRALYDYVSLFLHTPLFSHAAFAVVAMVLAGLFLWRRTPADVVMAALQLAGLGFAASFFVISLACDYRYLYFTDLAALTGLLYAAVDPRFGRQANRASQSAATSSRGRRAARKR